MMTKEDLQRLALLEANQAKPDSWQEWLDVCVEVASKAQLAERERCARLGIEHSNRGGLRYYVAMEIVDAIRGIE